MRGIMGVSVLAGLLTSLHAAEALRCFGSQCAESHLGDRVPVGRVPFKLLPFVVSE